MRAINKSREPILLREYRCKQDAVYEDTPTDVKDKIKGQLLEEQGYLCAYCMSRIFSDFGKMKVEHWHCQNNYPSEQLDYANMLGVCMGNEGMPSQYQTCDTKKGNLDLKYNPANPDHPIEQHLRFLANGTIQSDDEELDRQINEILNLNFARLQSNRKAIWCSVEQAYRDELSKNDGTRTSAEKLTVVNKLLNQWALRDNNGHHHPYCQVAIYYLNKLKK